MHSLHLLASYFFISGLHLHNVLIMLWRLFYSLEITYAWFRLFRIFVFNSFSIFRTMTAICFVCNLPILSHQVGLVWQGGNGWDDLVREQVEESTLRQRLGPGRRDSAAQISCVTPPTETRETSPPTTAVSFISAVGAVLCTHCSNY